MSASHTPSTKKSLILCKLVHNDERSAIEVFYKCHLARMARENRLGLKNFLYLFWFRVLFTDKRVFSSYMCVYNGS